MKVNKEEWKNIEGYIGRYQISNFGNVKSLKRKYVYKDKIMTLTKRQGYSIVSFSIDGKEKTKLVHRLVAEAFIPNPENKREVNHKDFKKTNNFISNLEWCSKSENLDHAIRNGVIGLKGEKNPRSILTNKQVREIRKKYVKKSAKCRPLNNAKILGQEYGVNEVTIFNIILRNSWKDI